MLTTSCSFNCSARRLGRKVRCPPTLQPLRKTTSAIEEDGLPDVTAPTHGLRKHVILASEVGGSRRIGSRETRNSRNALLQARPPTVPSEPSAVTTKTCGQSDSANSVFHDVTPIGRYFTLVSLSCE